MPNGAAAPRPLAPPTARLACNQKALCAHSASHGWIRRLVASWAVGVVVNRASRRVSGPRAVAHMAGTTEAHVPMKLKVPDGTDPPVGLAGWRALDGAERTAIRAGGTRCGLCARSRRRAHACA